MPSPSLYPPRQGPEGAERDRAPPLARIVLPPLHRVDGVDEVGPQHVAVPQRRHGPRRSRATGVAPTARAASVYRSQYSGGMGAAGYVFPPNVYDHVSEYHV